LWKADFNGTWHPVLVAAATPAPAGANTTAINSSSSGSGNPGSLMQTSASASSGVGGGATGLNRLQSAPNNNMQPSSAGPFGFGGQGVQQQHFTPQQQQQQQQHAISSSASFSGTAPSYMKTAPAQQQHHTVDEVKFSDHRSFN